MWNDDDKKEYSRKNHEWEENTRELSEYTLDCEETIPLRTNSTEYKTITAAKWLYLRDIRRRSFS